MPEVPVGSAPPPPTYEEKTDNSSSVEKGPADEYVVQADSKFQFDAADLDHVQRRLKQRHVQMIAVSTPFSHVRVRA